MEKINAYVPESLFFEGKQEAFGRIFREDSAIVFAHDNFRIIASRGTTMKENTSLYSLLDGSAASYERCRAALTSEKEVFVVPSIHGTLLLFSQMQKSTGLLLVIHVKAPEKDVRAVLDEAFLLSTTPILRTSQEDLKGTYDPSLPQILAEIFYYTNRIFSDLPTTDPRTLCRLIANFAGCQLTCTNVPLRPLALSTEERYRLIAFLFATFLGMQKFIDGVTAQAHESGVSPGALSSEEIPTISHESSALSLTISQTPSVRQYLQPRYRELLKKEKSLLLDRILKLPAFSHFYAAEHDGALVLEANFPTGSLLSATGAMGEFKQITFTFPALSFLTSLLETTEESYLLN
ncbi:MAG: hypothetical protein E7643_01115 [Ruminococcaceae bacterium]|nr:hypothetical protein [Oscillospiraceae bacterium]